MKKYKCIVFDFDGTLANTKKGVLNSISFALSKINYEVIIDDSMIGPSPFHLYRNILKLDQKSTKICIKNHRKYGDKKGFMESELFDGVEQTLRILKNSNYKLFIVSSKKDSTLKKASSYLKLTKYFDEIYGIKNEEDKKSSLLKDHILPLCDNQNILYVGDTEYDYDAAKSNNIDFCFIESGYGELGKEKVCYRINKFIDLPTIL